MTTDTDLSGCVGVVTGASAGIGAATARRLAARGMSLALGARRLQRLDELAEELRRTHGVEVLPAALDVRDGASVAASGAAADAFAGTGAVHLLVNNAGLARGVTRLPAATADDERDWGEVIDGNVVGLLRTTPRVPPGLGARASAGVPSASASRGTNSSIVARSDSVVAVSLRTLARPRPSSTTRDVPSGSCETCTTRATVPMRNRSALPGSSTPGAFCAISRTR